MYRTHPAFTVPYPNHSEQPTPGTSYVWIECFWGVSSILFVSSFTEWRRASTGGAGCARERNRGRLGTQGCRRGGCHGGRR